MDDLVTQTQTLKSSQLDIIQAYIKYQTALQNFRGLMQKLNLKRIKQEQSSSSKYYDPCNPVNYRILGNNPDLLDSGKFDLKLIKHNQKLNFLAEKTVESLVDYMAVKLNYLSLSRTQMLIEELGNESKEYVYNQSSKPLNLGAKLDKGSKLDNLEQLTTLEQDKEQTSLFNPEENQSQACNQGVRLLNVGMSGGSDSTLVLILASKLAFKYPNQYKAQAIHCIHGLDPDDQIWLDHNRKLCESLQVSLHTPVLNIVYSQGISPEDSSRKERYKALFSYCRPEQDFLLLGHQADDQVEGFLLALKRGAGPQGLSGMSFNKLTEQAMIIRPVLDLHKIEVEQLLVCLNFKYVFDLSNNYMKFDRNFMRLKVLPTIRQRFKGIDRAILRSQQLCSIEHDLAERYAQEQVTKYIISTDYEPFQKFNFKDLDLCDRSLVFMLLRTWIRQCTGQVVEFNILEQLYLLMLKEHYVNGLVSLGICDLSDHKEYVASSFLHYLCIYKEADYKNTEHFVKQHNLKLNLSALEQVLQKQELTSSITLSEPLVLEQVQYTLTYVPYNLIVEDLEQIALLKQVQRSKDTNLAPKSNLGCKELKDHLINQCFSLTYEQIEALRDNQAQICLDFDYALSSKLKARVRRHSREIKKLFVEYEIEPFARYRQPLVKLDQKVLALGNVCAVGSSIEEDFNLKGSQSQQEVQSRSLLTDQQTYYFKLQIS